MIFKKNSKHLSAFSYTINGGPSVSDKVFFTTSDTFLTGMNWGTQEEEEEEETDHQRGQVSPSLAEVEAGIT